MIAQSFSMAWAAICSNKMRSFLTMLGIIIGVMALVVLVSLVSNSTNSVKDTISKMGSDHLTVSISDDKGNPLRLADVAELANEDSIEAAAPIANSNATVRYGSSEESASIYGTTGAYAQIEGLELASGRFLNRSDMDNHTYVAVVNAGLAEEVLGTMQAAGQTITVDGIPCQVVGVLAADDSDSSSTENLEAYIPFTTYGRIMDASTNEVTRFVVAASDSEALDKAESKIESILMNRLQDDDDAFSIINQSTIADAMSSVTDTLSLLLGGIAAISLLVGGIGIMNIMLVSVTERTREIGIRKAIGAPKRVILMQFLIEALMVSLMGCAIGIALSWLTLIIMGIVGETTYTLSVPVVFAATVFSLAIGVVFGLYPANKAANMKPIDALRHTG